jgi:hypothetical protein
VGSEGKDGEDRNRMGEWEIEKRYVGRKGRRRKNRAIDTRSAKRSEEE